MAKRSWEPKPYPIRDPRTPKRTVGRVVNPPRALRLGGRGEEHILPDAKGGQGIGPVSDRGRGGRG